MKPALLVSIGTLLFPALALAESTPASGAHASLDPDAPPPGVHVIDDSEPKIPLIPLAKDLLGSHLLVGAAVGPAWSFGHLGSDVASSRGLGTGLGVRADAGLGLSRAVVLGAWGSYAGYADGNGCGSSCSGRA